MDKSKSSDAASATEHSSKPNLFRRALSLRHRLTGSHRKAHHTIHHISAPILLPTDHLPADLLAYTASTSAHRSSGEFWPSSDPISNASDAGSACSDAKEPGTPTKKTSLARSLFGSDTKKAKAKRRSHEPPSTSYLAFPIPTLSIAPKRAVATTSTATTTTDTIARLEAESAAMRPTSPESTHAAAVNDRAVMSPQPLQRAASTPPEFPTSARVHPHQLSHSPMGPPDATHTNDITTWPHTATAPTASPSGTYTHPSRHVSTKRFGDLSPIVSASNAENESKLAATARSVMSSSAAFLRNSGIFTSSHDEQSAGMPHYYSEQFDVVNAYTSMPSGQTSPADSPCDESILAATAAIHAHIMEEKSDGDDGDDDDNDSMPDPLLSPKKMSGAAHAAEQQRADTTKRHETPPQSPRVARLSAELHAIRRKLMTLYLMNDDEAQEADAQQDTASSVPATAKTDAMPKEAAAATTAPASGWVAKNAEREKRVPRAMEPVASTAVSDIDDDDDHHELTDDEQIAEDNHRSLMTLLSKQARAESILVRSLEVMRDDFWRPLHDYYCRDSSFSGWLGRRASSFTGRARAVSRNNSTATSASSSSSSNMGAASVPLAAMDGPSTTASIRRKSHESTLNRNSDVISHLSGRRMAEIIEAEATASDTPAMVREVNGIFAFVPDLLAFHLDFSSELQLLLHEKGSIDGVVALFERRVRGLRLYADYVDRYPRAFITLERLCYRDSKFAKQLRECERVAGYVNLRSILSKPRERICAYVGFLEVAADLRPSGSMAQKIADSAVDELHRLLECLTPDLDRITLLEQVAAVQRRIHNLPQPLLHLESRLLHQGELLYYPKTGQANGRMYCFLFNDRLVVTKETADAHQYAHQTTVVLTRTVVTASEASTGRFRHVFCLRAGAWPAIFQADDWDSFRTWTEHLRLALDALPNDPMIPTRFRLVTKLQLAQMENTRSSMVMVPHLI
ncbi:hypothetical protein SYNPS1DRAFT_22291 [Syncephalis pseudoplumigaleata]|uniref:DH domain-containing protein n=1 Tax=Syncephalis pseudoplumigaleata TaxID=1712513 RepID=A0A4P9Z046_9FUNG|nr:hypothetical protein SYNPS1DRAFT_22291 [Syncephalis pseudoplumigaleata]|eukprot:RKP25823.1 hypothetical protein SYNPS1DRAFT_22291 [Syncephalis pseudoplumigaleata]